MISCGTAARVNGRGATSLGAGFHMTNYELYHSDPVLVCNRFYDGFLLCGLTHCIVWRGTGRRRSQSSYHRHFSYYTVHIAYAISNIFWLSR